MKTMKRERAELTETERGLIDFAHFSFRALLEHNGLKVPAADSDDETKLLNAMAVYVLDANPDTTPSASST